MMDLNTGIYTIVITVVALFLIEKVVNFLGQFFGLYTIVQEKESKVFVLFGEVLGVIDEPGFHFLLPKLGPKALLVNWFGTTYSRSLKLNQEYLRSIPVNSEEGAPMGIGVWYEMYISDPVAHIFKNVDPQGSLSVNVKNDTIKNLSNLPLSEMLVNRHGMSKAVREEVSSESVEWGYQLGSVYIRKVHFRDENMIKQVEEKVVNRLRQVTSAIQQDGVNQVNIIKSKADREASIEFAKASAVRPQIVGKTLHDISTDQDVLAALFDILETQNITGSATTDLTLIPPGSGKTALSALLASK
jgi:regulator of protease activity HflC (stomatin/prohibitin superfamily)